MAPPMNMSMKSCITTPCFEDVKFCKSTCDTRYYLGLHKLIQRRKKIFAIVNRVLLHNPLDHAQKLDALKEYHNNPNTCYDM